MTKQFRTTFLAKCLSRSQLNDKKASLFMHDISIAGDFPLGLKGYRLIDSLSSALNYQITQDSIDRTNRLCNGCRPDELLRMRQSGLIGKGGLQTCLDFYESNELKSIIEKFLK